MGVGWNSLAAVGTGHPRVSGVEGLVAEVRAASPDHEESEQPAKACRDAEAFWVFVAQGLDDVAHRDGRQDGQSWAPDRTGLKQLERLAL